MKIKNQDFNIDDPEFEYDLDSEFEVEINLSQDCFANCVLVVSGYIDADEGLYPHCYEYKIRTEKGAEKIVSLDAALEIKIDSEIDDLFQKKFNEYCEKEEEEMLINLYEDSIYD